MSADIVNLRQARKHKKRAAKEKQAEENRRSFGRSKAQRQLSSLERERFNRQLDGAQINSEKLGNLKKTKDQEDT
ncbi:DUF4169 family protein [Pseudovibrio exalbescens]|uniref:DUF4169 domain-containing protein n=1 Tax=Pseudovibrio exalbescens TaxID=197461 RepID=A0A1U7JKY2_9HYPH|nr:DUF4169 family protein [Pseudovibrio exalbescens]OKL45377.1 hypothetical protein A3843_03360 [Pseudovibrio exalbescens]